MPSPRTPADHPLRVFRLSKGWSLAEFAEKAQVGLTTLWRIEDRGHVPSFDAFERIIFAGRGEITPEMVVPVCPYCDKPVPKKRAPRRGRGAAAAPPATPS